MLIFLGISGRFIFFTADTARAGAPAKPASDFSSLFCASICVTISFMFVSNTIPPITISARILWTLSTWKIKSSSQTSRVWYPEAVGLARAPVWVCLWARACWSQKPHLHLASQGEEEPVVWYGLESRQPLPVLDDAHHGTQTSSHGISSPCPLHPERWWRQSGFEAAELGWEGEAEMMSVFKNCAHLQEWPTVECRFWQRGFYALASPLSEVSPSLHRGSSKRIHRCMLVEKCKWKTSLF